MSRAHTYAHGDYGQLRSRLSCMTTGSGRVSQLPSQGSMESDDHNELGPLVCQKLPWAKQGLRSKGASAYRILRPRIWVQYECKGLLLQVALHPGWGRPDSRKLASTTLVGLQKLITSVYKLTNFRQGESLLKASVHQYVQDQMATIMKDRHNLMVTTLENKRKLPTTAHTPTK